MKKFKSRDKSFYVLLIKNYIIFTLVMGTLILAIYYMETLVESSIIKTPKVDQPLGGQELLTAGEYVKLDMNQLLGATGYFEVLDEKNQLIYSSSSDHTEHYTEQEIEYIPEYNSHYFYTMAEYVTESGEVQILVTQSSYEPDTGYYEDIGYMVLDESLTVVMSNLPCQAKQFTKRELGFLTMRESMLYDVYKYRFTEKNGGNRTLLMHAKRLDRQGYKKLTSLWKIFMPIYIFSYLVITIIFTIWMHRKVRDPLDMLNEGILAFAEGNRDTEISYKGPREFEMIFDSFNKMSRQLKESESAKEKLIVEKQRMLADISHDLKTPITVIQGYAKAVSDGLTDPEKEKQYLNTIFEKTESLTRMINTFYDYSKLEHPEFVFMRETMDMAEFIREYLADKYDEICLYGFELEVEIPDETIDFSFDPVQMRRVFDNILANALKHNPSGTIIFMTIQQTDRSIRIEIGDNGVGIPQELKENLFDPFIVGDDSRNNKQGSGLGLAVAKKIVELHGGALFLENEKIPAVSTLFVIRLMK